MANLLHVYTGDGKGKTTAAMGLALRALGHGWHVMLAQFMKDGQSGELKALAKLPNVTLDGGMPMRGFLFQMTPAEREQAVRMQTAHARALTSRIAQERPQLVVLDELAVALDTGLLSRETAEALLDAALACGECVVTGRGAPTWLTERADYVSVVTAMKHPYDKRGLEAREGIEW